MWTDGLRRLEGDYLIDYSPYFEGNAGNDSNELSMQRSLSLKYCI